MKPVIIISTFPS